MSVPLLDVVREIRIDHDNVRDLRDRYKAESDTQNKKAIANTLVREMAIHGDAEELSIYRKYHELGLGDTVEHNKEEHAEIKKLVYEADTSTFDSPEYDSKLLTAVETFISHAEEEENGQLDKINDLISTEETDAAARDFLKARTMAPTRPHPSAPQTGGVAQKAAGMPGAMVDKVLETVQGRQFVDLKYAHPESY